MHNEAVRERLQQRRAELHLRAGRIDSDLRGDSIPTEGGFADQASAHANDVVLEAIRASADTELQQIDNALRRLDEGCYGTCVKCKGPIGQDRLKAVPYATTCIDCAEGDVSAS